MKHDENIPRQEVPGPSRTVLETRQKIGDELQQTRWALEERTRQLDQSLSVLRAAIESTADGILFTDEDGRILRFNEHYLQMWGIFRENAERSAQHHQLLESCAALLKDPEQFMRRTADIYASWPQESHDVLALADGRVFERYSTIQYVEGKSIGRVWSFRDVTARVHAEEALQESGERMCFMADAMPQKIFTARADGKFDYFNQQWKDYTGLAPQELAGWEWTRLIHSDDLDETVTGWLRSVRTGEPYQMECRFRQADGDYRWHLLRAQARRGSNGEVSMWVGSNTDIDILKRSNGEKQELLERERIARGEAERANQSKDEFLATLSHELRTPLNAILGWSQLILQGTMRQEDIQRGLEIIDRNARAQNKLIEDLLEMSSIVSGKVRLEVQQLDLAHVAEAAVESMLPAAQAKGIHLRKMVDPAAGLVIGDNNRLQQVIWNLLSNAVKFTPKGGTIEVIVERVASNLELTVRDSGVGIQREFLAYVFDRFRQADSSLTRSHGGLGLGLAIVKQLVTLHGGTVRAESAGEGRGASFIVNLPLVPIKDRKDTKLSGRPRRNPGYGEVTLKGQKVLVIEDEPDARELIKEALTQCEADVVTAASAMEGLEVVKNQRLDVLISDIGMPGEDGYQFIRAVRNLPEAQGGRTPAIALTAFAHSTDRTKALLAGYQRHLSKPVESHELIATVGSLTGWAGRQKIGEDACQ
ncbi:ATP-binding protein [Nitrosospira sp. Is2]|uniref:PAS domain-containing hybrid sensor histidine kinase/response regulator n=1 Tax=Nitrosospira sp. Is2 TaxID=3080532 RepID=UPI002953BF23|nr:ATP-binding protein [Nitrosospira sp. Is2]WON73793.1 ATP-binding protein [Nitrosospira sp. Is2]